MESSNIAVIETYEAKIAKLSTEKALPSETLANQAEPKGSFAEKLEPALIFLSRPWKIRENMSVAARRPVLKLAFTDRIRYVRNEGATTAELAFPFKALGAVCPLRSLMGERPLNPT